MMEVIDEAQYVKHHPKKIIFILSAMRHFAEQLKCKDYRVEYIKLESIRSRGGFTETLAYFLEKRHFDKIIVTEPGEYRVLKMIQSWEKQTGIPIEIKDDNRFFISRKYFETWAAGKKQLLMENFYRQMRKKTGLLMNNNKPAGGQWNYDKENRKTAQASANFPTPKQFKPDTITEQIIRLVKKRFADHFGDPEPFWFAVTTADAKKAFKHFIQHALPYFGDYQDAMLSDQNFLYHSVISHYLNAGLLDAREVCKAVEEGYRKGKVPLNAAEGFIRQILGWREYIRSIYWLKMPEYAKSNFFDAKRPLPNAYWGANTDMNCIRQVVKQTQEQAYSHHIQRLMITGNFAMLLGVSPQALHEWYLAVYADAYEWVEMPNTIGMAIFADGGVVGTKPYAASGAYINKMSDFCSNCHYKVNQKTGEQACPFNYLYWSFLYKHRNLLCNNRRLLFAYKNLSRFSDEKLSTILQDTKKFIKKTYP